MIARELVTYQQQLRKLQPDFDDCPEPCQKDQKDLPEWCQGCEVKQQWEFFREGFERAIEKRFEGEACGWTFEQLYSDLRKVQKADRDVKGKGYPRGCDVLKARCLDILRSEEYRPRRIQNWELEQKLKNKPNDR